MRPVDSRQLAALRIVFGLLAIFYFVERMPFSWLYLSSSGWLDDEIFRNSFSGLIRLPLVFQYWPTLLGLFLLFISSAALMTIGFAARITTVITWIGLFVIENQNPLMQVRGTEGLRLIIFFLMFSETGGRWSIDAWLYSFRRKETSPWWPYFLIRTQIVLAFVLAGISKAASPYWIEGDALVYLLLNPETSALAPVTVADFSVIFFPLSSIVSRFWVVFEIAFPFLALVPLLKTAVLKVAAVAFVVAFLVLQMSWVPLMALAMLTGLLGPVQVKDIEKRALKLWARIKEKRQRSGTRAVALTKE